MLPTGLGPNQDLRRESPDGVDTLEEASMSLSCFLHVLYPFVLYVALALEDAIFELFVPGVSVFYWTSGVFKYSMQVGQLVLPFPWFFL